MKIHVHTKNVHLTSVETETRLVLALDWGGEEMIAKGYTDSSEND